MATRTRPSAAAAADADVGAAPPSAARWVAGGRLPKTPGRCASGWQSAADPGPPWIPRARAAQAPTSTRLPPRPPDVTTGRQAAPSASEPGGHARGRSHVAARPARPPPALAVDGVVPRGHAAPAEAHPRRPASTIATAGAAHAAAAGSEARGTQAPVTTSSDCPAAHARNAHPPSLLGAPLVARLAARPQKASPTGGGTHAPSKGTSPSAHAHRPDEPRAESRGHAAAHEMPSHTGARAQPAAATAAAPSVSVSVHAASARIERRIARDATDSPPCSRRS